jgi:hypothetical protein
MRAIVVLVAAFLLQQGPPPTPEATRHPDLVELVKLDRTIKQRPAAEALLWKEYPILDIAFSEIK